MKFIVSTITVSILFISQLFADGLVVDITEGKVAPLPIAINSFVDGDAVSEVGRDIVRVITNDLVSSGLFEVIDPKAFIEKPKSSKSPRSKLVRAVTASIFRLFLFSAAFSIKAWLP